ncbi:complement C1q-like protein 3 [Saccostrea echinata]|uniref:complement C1q-like protein 3 n=1 Tax=Saccostrea echinata TaxID=191078 RepID=UPI002A81E6D1|nr:complement C1q-like protein 3 [Saccostrea echinata]
MALFFSLLGFFIVTVAGSTCGDRNSCSMELYEYENCVKAQHTAMEVRLHTLETEMKRLHQENSRVVSFFAGLSASVTPVIGLLKFDNVMLNRGEVYNGTTGLFTAPVNGVYSFTLTIGLPQPEQATDYFRMHIMKNKEIIGYLFIEWEGKWTKRSESVVVELQEGDRVHAMVATAPAAFTQIGGTSSYPGTPYSSHFSGFLIQHDHKH